LGAPVFLRVRESTYLYGEVSKQDVLAREVLNLFDEVTFHQLNGHCKQNKDYHVKADTHDSQFRPVEVPKDGVDSAVVTVHDCKDGVPFAKA